MFDAARLDEAEGRLDDARKMYDQIDSLYPTSIWISSRRTVSSS